MNRIPLFIIPFLITTLVYSATQKNLPEIYGRYLKGLNYFEEGKFKESLEEFKKVKKLDPDSSFIRLKIAFVLIKLGELEEAEKELKVAKKIDPDNLEASLGLIFLYSYSNREEVTHPQHLICLVG